MIYSVTDFKTIGDGMEKDTKAVQKAIDTCHLEGGGTVFFPRGKYLCGTLYLKSNVALDISHNATLIASSESVDYPEDTHMQLYHDETRMDRCFIFAKDCENISICGTGTIHGNGELFTTERPMMIRYLNCTNIKIRDVNMISPASWTNAFINCSYINVSGIHIKSRAKPNGDGLDFDACKHVMVTNCNFDCSDDCICLQNSFEDELCTYVTISNCIFKSQWAGIRIGLLSCGDISNVTVTNCIFTNINCSGLKIQSSEGATLKNMTFSNLIMENVQRPIFMTANRFRERIERPDEITTPSRIDNIKFRDIMSNSAEKNEEKIMENQPACIILDCEEGCEISNISLIGVSNVVAGGKENISCDDILEHTNKRAEGFNYQGDLPALGLFARRIDKLNVLNCKFSAASPDERDLVVLL